MRNFIKGEFIHMIKQHTFKIFLIIFVCFVPSFYLHTEISKPTEYIEQAFDVIKYEVSLDLSKAPEQTDVIGKCDIYFLWNEIGDNKKFYLHLYDLTIDSAFFKNSKISLQKIIHDDGNYYYELSDNVLTTTDTNRITIYYSGKMTNEGGENPWGGVSTDSKILFTMGVGFRNNYVSATRHWMPCYDHPSDKVLFRGEFKVRKGLFVASNGQLISHLENNDFDIFIWEHNYPASTYLLTFAVSEFIPVEFHSDNVKVPMIVYTPKMYEEKVKFTFRLLPDMLKAYELLFDKYPFEKVGYVLTPIGSMEHQTMISYDINTLNYYYSVRDTMNSTAAHELSHQWFGNYVTCRDFRDAWLNEGFATFCEPLWLEYKFDYERYLRAINNYILRYINTISKMEGVFSLYDFPRQYPSSNYPGTIYYKGAIVLAMLRYELGDDLFFQCVREYLKRFAYGTATTELFKQTFEEVSARDLNQFINQWIYGKGYPIIKIEAEKQPVSNYFNLNVKITQIQPQDYGIYKNLYVELDLVDKVGISEYKIIRLDSAVQQYYLEGLGDIQTIRINTGKSLRSLVQLANVEIFTSVANHKLISEIELYPNPANNELNLNLPENYNAQILILDLSGRVLKRIDFIEFIDYRKIKIDTSDLSSGVYILSSYDGFSSYKKLFSIIK